MRISGENHTNYWLPWWPQGIVTTVAKCYTIIVLMATVYFLCKSVAVISQLVMLTVGAETVARWNKANTVLVRPREESVREIGSFLDCKIVSYCRLVVGGRGMHFYCISRWSEP